jgi:hypothetical protein
MLPSAVSVGTIVICPDIETQLAGSNSVSRFVIGDEDW